MNTVIILALMFGIGYLPPVGPLTPFGMDVLAKYTRAGINGIDRICSGNCNDEKRIWRSDSALRSLQHHFLQCD